MKYAFCAFCALALIAFAQVKSYNQAIDDEEQRAEAFIADYEVEMTSQTNLKVQAEWAYASNVTDYNDNVKNEVSTAFANYVKRKATEARGFDFENFQNAELQRKFRIIVKIDSAILSEPDYRELLAAKSAMESNYAKARVCDYTVRSKCDLQLEPEISNVFDTSRDPDELKYYWQQWYDTAGTPVRDQFYTYVRLVNQAAKLNNLDSNAEAWLDVYEDSTFEDQLLDAVVKLRPLYEQLHAYCRYKIREQYGPDLVCSDGLIPMHLTGNVWGQSWSNIADFSMPYPDKKKLDVTEEMIKQGFTPLRMYQLGDEFFKSLNLTDLPDEFWQHSIIEKPNDGRDIICHASAWDFFSPNDVRCKMCTRVTMDQLKVVHHELGHIQYYLQYQNQSVMYRNGANPGFHEAVGDVMALSVATPNHFQRIGLLKDYFEDYETKMNQLFTDALSKVVFVPFAYTLDYYRWSIFRGKISADQANTEFWRLREEFSGIAPPVPRTDSDFDPPAKYHMSADVEYARYLASYVLQFQIHKAACERAGQYEKDNPNKTLSSCDIYQSAEAGNAIKEMLQLGSSKPWPEALELLTGTRKMDVSALLEYFKPLHEWLIVKNKAIGAPIGWKDAKCN